MLIARSFGTFGDDVLISKFDLNVSFITHFLLTVGWRKSHPTGNFPPTALFAVGRVIKKAVLPKHEAIY